MKIRTDQQHLNPLMRPITHSGEDNLRAGFGRKLRGLCKLFSSSLNPLNSFNVFNLFTAAAVLLSVAVVSAADVPEKSDLAATNAPSQNRQERERRPSRQAEQASSVPDYSAFRIITERNIFDPNRAPRRSEPVVRSRPRTVDSFALVGIMSYEKGTYAFFDGSKTEFRKALKKSDDIAGFKVAFIDDNSVKLTSGAKEFDLRVGTQLQREEEGEWKASSRTETYASTEGSSSRSSRFSDTRTPSAATPPAVPTEADNEVLRRLMERREKE